MLFLCKQTFDYQTMRFHAGSIYSIDLDFDSIDPGLYILLDDEGIQITNNDDDGVTEEEQSWHE
jgi:hypothetical protein